MQITVWEWILITGAIIFIFPLIRKVTGLLWGIIYERFEI